MSMKSKSASSLTWFALILIPIGLSVESPVGSFAVCVAAAASAGVAACIGTGRLRVRGIIVLALATFLAFAYYSEFRSAMNRYKERASSHAPATTRQE